MTSPTVHVPRAQLSSRLRLALIVAACAPSSCLLVPRFEAVDPEFAYVDGCTDIVLQGAKLGTDATVTIGGVALLSLKAAENDKKLPDYAQDVGFKYFGVSPPAPNGEPGFQDVVMTVGQDQFTLPKGFYYMACPGELTIDSVDFGVGATAGSSVTLTGCGIEADKVTGHLLSAVDGTDAGSFTLASSCLTAKATFNIPNVAPGDYWLQLVHEDGSTYGGICPDQAPVVTDTDSPDTDVSDTDVVVDTDLSDTDVVVDTDAPDTDVSDTDPTSDTDVTDSSGGGADTADPCAGYTLVTVTGGE